MEKKWRRSCKKNCLTGEKNWGKNGEKKCPTGEKEVKKMGRNGAKDCPTGQKKWRKNGEKTKKICPTGGTGTHLLGGAGPDEHTGEATGLDVAQVGDDDLAVHQRSQPLAARRLQARRLHVLDAVQIGQVHPLAVGGGAVVPVFLQVQRVEAGVHAINALEQQDHLRNTPGGGEIWLRVC